MINDSILIGSYAMMLRGVDLPHSTLKDIDILATTKDAINLLEHFQIATYTHHYRDRSLSQTVFGTVFDIDRFVTQNEIDFITNIIKQKSIVLIDRIYIPLYVATPEIEWAISHAANRQFDKAVEKREFLDKYTQNSLTDQHYELLEILKNKIERERSK